MSIIEATANAAKISDRQGFEEVLDFLVTEEALGVTFVTAAIENGCGTPSEPFLPVLQNAVTQEFHHVEALKAAGGEALTDRYWFPDAAFDGGGVDDRHGCPFEVGERLPTTVRRGAARDVRRTTGHRGADLRHATTEHARDGVDAGAASSPTSWARRRTSSARRDRR